MRFAGRGESSSEVSQVAAWEEHASRGRFVFLVEGDVEVSPREVDVIGTLLLDARGTDDSKDNLLRTGCRVSASNSESESESSPSYPSGRFSEALVRFRFRVEVPETVVRPWFTL